MTEIKKGMPVWDVRGLAVGTVTAFTAAAFEVEERPPGAANVWLELAAIFSVDDRGVSLVCNIHDIGRYAVDRTVGYRVRVGLARLRECLTTDFRIPGIPG